MKNRMSMRFIAVALVAAAVSASAFAEGWIGLRVADSRDGGVRVLDVCEKGPAQQAGIRRGDTVAAVNGVPVAGGEAFVRAIRELAPGATVELSVSRPGEAPRRVSVAATERPAKDPETACQNPRVRIFVPSVSDHIHPHKVRSPYVGVLVQEMTPELREYFGVGRDAGVLVVQVDGEGPAAGAVEVGDVLVAADGAPVKCGADLAASVGGKKDGDAMSLTLVRRKQAREARVVLKEREKTRFDLGALMSGRGACPMDKDGSCRFIWHWNEDDFETSLKRLEEFFHGGGCEEAMRLRAERQKTLEDKLRQLEDRLREVQQQLRSKSAPPV
jgi:S1-C subfamily serine protease